MKASSALRGDDEVVWPPVQPGGAGQLDRLVATLESSQWLAPHELRDRALMQLARTARHHHATSPFFAERLKSAGLSPGDLGNEAGLRSLPPMRRRDAQDAGPGLYSTAVPAQHGAVHENRTSGSTGEPVVVRKTGITNLIWAANTVRDHVWFRREAILPMVMIRATFTRRTDARNWGRPIGTMFRSGGSIRLPISTPIAEQAAIIRAVRPGTLVSYSNNLSILIEELEKSGGAWPEVQHLQTVSETTTDALRERARGYFGLEIEDVYSAQEAGIIAVQCPDCRQYHVMAESVFVEVVGDDDGPCREGEVGRVLVSDLTNYATPVIRYEIGDYAEVGGVAACGRGLPALRRVLGRDRNLILMPDGRRQWPLTGFYRFREIAPVLQYQLVQATRERIEVNLVTGRPLMAEEEAQLRDVILSSLGYPFELQFRYHDRMLPRGPNGKFEDFVCRL